MKYRVWAFFEAQDLYEVDADSEEEAIEIAQDAIGEEGKRGTVVYVRDAESECVDWNAEPIGEDEDA